MFAWWAGKVGVVFYAKNCPNLSPVGGDVGRGVNPRSVRKCSRFINLVQTIFIIVTLCFAPTQEPPIVSLTGSTEHSSVRSGWWKAKNLFTP
ncbi:hypothetical protein GDO81_028060 [Engystomops pustulosus]|uniref:Uncharacterized protein n=1 Tax=Engystomops pustulosus TaxID=76066 RepID=A0AAV6YL24_ENGPU|nr:hypothetical protein GDO81_028060 [Engystomops pustulosus]